MKDWLDQIKWDADGLVPAIAQDHKTGRVLVTPRRFRQFASRSRHWLSANDQIQTHRNHDAGRPVAARP